MTAADNALVVPLPHFGAKDAAQVGHKAATLGELKRAGFPVPDGVVITSEVLARVLTETELDDNTSLGRVTALLNEMPLPDEVSAAITTEICRLGSGPFVVRSSAVDEDLPEASYAGQYESVLNVPVTELSDAIRRCWASAFTAHVTAYRRFRGARQHAVMAVLIQPMVRAEAAGVAFSADPVTGDRASVVVSAVRGTADRLVAGQVTPDEWLVRGGAATCRTASEGAIDADTAIAVAKLAQRVADQVGTPQDIEWALANKEIALLQARPITALPVQPADPVPIPIKIPQGFWERESILAPKPWTPVSLSVLFGEVINRTAHRGFVEFGLLVETLKWTQIGGWYYRRLVPLGGKDRPTPPAWLMPVLIRLVPRMRRRIRTAVSAIRSDKAGRFLQRWCEEWRPHLATRIAALRDVDLAELDDTDLEQHTTDAAGLLDDAFGIHFLLHGMLVMILADLAFTSRDLLQWSDEETFGLLAGLSNTSTAPAYRLAELARLADDRPSVKRLLDRIDADTHNRLANVDPEFSAAFANYQREFGCRTLRYEIADPTVAETPELILRLLADQLTRRYDPTAVMAALAERRAAVAARARTMLTGRSPEERDRFERALVRAERAYPVREDSELLTVSAPLALVRYAVLEIGRRLVERGQLGQRDDVFFLKLDEVRTALRSGEDQRQLVRYRWGERAWAERHPGPASYGTPPGPPPALDAFPKEVQFSMSALLWYIDRVFEAEPSTRIQTAGTTILSGVGVSAGRYTGLVRLIRDESDFSRIRPGDVLVCPSIAPVWSMLFPSVGALVTDVGGLLSHAAIIAREYSVPAVVALGNATSMLCDDQIVTVDGSIGYVELTDSVSS
jgi:phosphohistidine swiveling domain-containing protein